MGDDPKPPAPRPPETWSALVLRNPDGEFLAQRNSDAEFLSGPSTARLWTTKAPFFIEWFTSLIDLGNWLKLRPALFRSRLEAEGYRPIRMNLTAPDHDEPRPLVAEAVVE